jgi:hypothetical protein
MNENLTFTKNASRTAFAPKNCFAIPRVQVTSVSAQFLLGQNRVLCSISANGGKKKK